MPDKFWTNKQEHYLMTIDDDPRIVLEMDLCFPETTLLFKQNTNMIIWHGRIRANYLDQMLHLIFEGKNRVEKQDNH